MAPKKNAFFVFLTQYRDEEIQQGKRPSNFQTLAKKLTPIWNSMSDVEKNKYKQLAKDLNLHQKVEKNQPEQIEQLYINTNDYWMMRDFLTKMFEAIPDTKELLKQKFLLLHVNCHVHNGEKYYFPAEIAVLEFTLLDGISRSYHQLIGLSKIYPRGFAGGMREYSDHFHQISCWDDHPDDYKQILLDFLSFLNGETVDLTTLHENKLSLPYIYTVETEVGFDMMKTKSSLEKLYNTVFPDLGSEQCRTVFKVGSLERLFTEINKKLNIHLNERNIRSGMSVREILEAGMYGHGIGCSFHEIREIAFKCSKSRIIQWMSNICLHLNEYFGLQILPGRHTAAILRDGTRLVIEKENGSDLQHNEITLAQNTSINTSHSESSVFVLPTFSLDLSDCEEEDENSD